LPDRGIEQAAADFLTAAAATNPMKAVPQERTMTGYILTRIDIAALLKADRMVVHYNGGNVTESRIYAVKEKRPSETDPFATDVTYNLSIPIDVTGYGYNGLHSS
jgi:hypothetical protein